MLSLDNLNEIELSGEKIVIFKKVYKEDNLNQSFKKSLSKERFRARSVLANCQGIGYFYL